MTKKKSKTEHEFSKYGTAFAVMPGQAPLIDDKSGKRYEAGYVVTVEDFEPAVLENWLAIGAIEPKEVE